ncbi:MAG: ABC transporter ATP-binding protein [Rubrivivax sp.]|jgi:putative ABC transport system ATP-binding protein|nr:ABC transporter ATP-binding protein [Rubrivivax sp.]
MLELRQLSKAYHLGDGLLPALSDVDLVLPTGSFVALTGASGSGKSTLMNILGCLDTPTRGEYWLDGRAVQDLSDTQLARVRNECIGFIFQNFNLMPRMNAWENVAHPLVFRGIALGERRRRAEEALAAVGLGHRLHHRPTELSGGQRQRVAIARALVGQPRLLLADEPTGNLDSRTAVEIMDLLGSLHAQGMTLVIVTHETSIAERCHRVVCLHDGRIVEDRDLRTQQARMEAAR